MPEHKPPFLVEYNHDGKTYLFTMGADSWADAQSRLRSIGVNGRVIGSNVQSGPPVNSVTLPFVVLWMAIVVRWRNWTGR